MIYAETARLILRAPKPRDVPRLVELLNNLAVARWLTIVPHPYTTQHAEEFFARMYEAIDKGAPEYFLMERKNDAVQIGAVGLHPPREPHPVGKLMIGYWLGQPYWKQGFMSEAVIPVIRHAFARPEVDILVADADTENNASNQVLRKAEFSCVGTMPRREAALLRDNRDVMCWRLTRQEFERQGNKP